MATAPIIYELISFITVFILILLLFSFGNKKLKNKKNYFFYLIKSLGISFLILATMFVLSALRWDNPFLTLKPLLVEFVFGFVSLFIMFKLKTKLIWRYILGLLIFVTLSIFVAQWFLGRSFIPF